MNLAGVVLPLALWASFGACIAVIYTAINSWNREDFLRAIVWLLVWCAAGSLICLLAIAYVWVMSAK